MSTTSTPHASDQVVKEARRQEWDAAIGLAVAIVFGPLGIFLCLRSLGRIQELVDSLDDRGKVGSVQRHLTAARTLAVVGLVVSIAVPIAAGIWIAIFAQMQS